MSVGALQTPPAVVPELVPYLLSLNAALAELQRGGGSINQAQLETAVAVAVAASGSSSVSDSSSAPDMSVPPALSGLLAVGSFGAVILSWDVIPYGNHAYVNIYRSSTGVISQDMVIKSATGNSFAVGFDVLNYDGNGFIVPIEVLNYDGNGFIVKNGNAKAIGTSRSLVYADSVPSDSTWYYWISAVSKAGIEGPLNQVSGTAGIASLDPAYVLDILIGNKTDASLHQLPLVVGDVNGVQMVGLRGQLVVDGTITGNAIQADTIGANHISVVNLAALNGNMGVLTAGLIQSPDQTFTIDLAQKEIMITGPNGQATDDYMVLRNGIIEAWKYIAGQHILGKALTHIESGSANSNTTVQIPGYFEVQPSIQVSPKNVQIYSAANSTQDQTLECKATSITEYAVGQWQFHAYAALVLAAGSGEQFVNWFNGSTSSATINSAVQTTPGGVTDFSVRMRLYSFRGTGVAPNYFYRSANLKLFIRINGSGSAWTLVDSYLYNLPGEPPAGFMHIFDVSGLPANGYDFYVEAVYSDNVSGGTFVFGSGAYEYNSYTTPAISDYAAATAPDDSSQTSYLTASLAAYTPPSGWSIYNVTYSYRYGYYLFCGAGSLLGSGQAQAKVDGISGLYKFLSISNAFNWEQKTAGVVGATNYGSTISFTSSEYNRAFFKSAKAFASENGYSSANSELRITEAKAVINIRKAVANSTTPNNDLEIVRFDYTTGASTELSAGTLNWMAIGR